MQVYFYGGTLRLHLLSKQTASLGDITSKYKV